ncbi:putative cytochrome c-type biogenesis protein CcmF [Plesiocystis pacifica SIR-1]|uniref:Putative cytochrome c-type biogenesis protein CcmF n=1 Tax=Plesiocystis pacifica SIR-1 TaxID=391625 RepID=A6GFN3_9BACT|nr:cytochrome c-type biogenesis CcmF C-terminal domain-containing protein [Plesiocystis pacifica]EDM75347.1 putative cytochrome c-type biogenesis protein CcmF [Plesiocystis pacifica SIR-1]
MRVADLGTLSLVVLFAVCLATIAMAMLGARRRSARLVEGAVQGIYAMAGLATFASSLIIYAFLADDFSIQYVHHTSDSAMPLFYKITAFWGGLDGSLLFWVLLLSLFSALAVRANRHRHEELIPHVVWILAVINLFFVALLIFVKNPFEPFMLEPEMAGAPRGLNPLLQNAYMIIHPPSLYLGYVSLAVPYAFGMAAVITGTVDSAWQRSVRRWTLFSWSFLSFGLVLGGLWAYEELGWGGYWAWDPVENAGLIPWFTATAFLHSIMIQERRGMLKRWNVALVIFSFWLSIMGTFLTRSGVVQSVHAFGKDPQLAWIFGIFLVVILVGSFGVLIWRWDLLRARSELESPMSREFAFLINNWILLGMAFFVLGSTIWPTLSEWILDDRITIRESHYNHYMTPAGLALLLLMGVGPLLAWRRTSTESLQKQFTIPLLFGVVGTLLAMGLEARRLAGVLAEMGEAAPSAKELGAAFGDHVWALACFGLCAFTLATIAQEFARGISVAKRNNPKLSVVDAGIRLLLKARRRYGGYVIHLGVVLMFFGFAGKSYGVDRKINATPGDVIALGDYEIRHNGLTATEDWQKQMITAELEVIRNGRVVDVLEPARWWYFQLPEQPTTEVSRHMSVGEDVYASMQTVDMTTGVTQLRLFINPLVNWVWVGTTIMLLGAAICIGTKKKKGATHE